MRGAQLPDSYCLRGEVAAIAIIRLTKWFINLAESGEWVAAGSVERSGARSSDGEVTKFAGGRKRSLSVEGQRGEVSFTLVDVPYADVVTLETWKGRTVCIRDNLGKKFFGVFYEVPWSEPGKGQDLYSLDLTVQEVDFTEGL